MGKGNNGMALQHELFMNAVVASGGTIYSQPVDLGGNSNVFVGITTVVGSAALDATTGLEGSADLTNWGALSPGAAFTFAVAPTFASATFTSVGARYVRLKVKAGSGASCVNASLTATSG